MIEDPLIVAVRLGLYVTIGGVFGVSLFAISGLPIAALANLPLRAFVGVSAALGVVLSMFGIAVLAAGMAGMPLGTLTAADLQAVASMTGIGDAWVARTVALAAVAVATLIVRSNLAVAWAGVMFGAVALGSLAWNGHGAATEGWMGNIHLAADIAHLLAAGAWFGALLALGLLVRRAWVGRTHGEVTAAQIALKRFSVAGTVIVVTIIVSGLVNSWLLIGPDHIVGLRTTLYGRVLMAKLALFAGMCGLAAINRYRLTPALGRDYPTPDGAIGALRRSLVTETTAALLILTLVAWLGTLMPPTAA